MRAILLAVTGLDPQPWEERLRALAPRRGIYLWPQRLGDPADVAYACAWNAPRGLFARLPRLEAIFSLGAGVDHILADPELPDVPVVRIVDPDLTMRMTEYVVLHVLMHHRRPEILVCLLPGTPATQGMLDRKLIRKLKRDGAGAYLINAARGTLQVDADILAALDE